MFQVSDSFPFKWINKKWKEGFYVTCMATSHTRWAVVMSRNAGYIDQVPPASASARMLTDCLFVRALWISAPVQCAEQPLGTAYSCGAPSHHCMTLVVVIQ